MNGRKLVGAQLLRPGKAVVSREEARRVDQLVMRVGKQEAASLLGVSLTTLAIAVGQGSMRTDIRDRLMSRLTELEAQP